MATRKNIFQTLRKEEIEDQLDNDLSDDIYARHLCLCRWIYACFSDVEYNDFLDESLTITQFNDRVQHCGCRYFDGIGMRMSARKEQKSICEEERVEIATKSLMVVL